MSSSVPSYTYTYFNGRGRGEVPRWVLAAAKKNYEDKRVEFAEWPALKATTPFGSLPLLKVEKDGKSFTICQSGAVSSYLAREVDLMGDTPEDAARADMIAGCVTDAREIIIKIKFAKDDDAKVEAQKTWDEKKGGFFASFEKLLGKEEYFVAKKLTLADLALVELLNSGDFDLTGYDKLQQLKTRVEANPNIAKWIKERPVTSM